VTIGWVEVVVPKQANVVVLPETDTFTEVGLKLLSVLVQSFSTAAQIPVPAALPGAARAAAGQ
jgi:hypothetical protein